MPSHPPNVPSFKRHARVVCSSCALDTLRLVQIDTPWQGKCLLCNACDHMAAESSAWRGEVFARSDWSCDCAIPVQLYSDLYVIMVEAAQLDKMDLHSFLGLDLPAPIPMPHHTLFPNGQGLLGDCCGPAFLDDSPNTSVDSLCCSGSSAFPFEGELGEDFVLPYDKKHAPSMAFPEHSQVLWATDYLSSSLPPVPWSRRRSRKQWVLFGRSEGWIAFWYVMVRKLHWMASRSTWMIYLNVRSHLSIEGEAAKITADAHDILDLRRREEQAFTDLCG